jgi:hypothetical protein
MAIIVPATFRGQLATGTHNLTTATLKMALYTSALTAATTAYSATNEASGTGYSAGGATMALASGYPATDSDGRITYRYDTVTWSTATFSASWALIYNSSASNYAVLVLDLGGTRTVTASTFSVAFPTTLPAILRIT